eukprot:m.279827 g.279827  ORF g.279827 m.279827 type:complete len:267 (-) comp16323_c11_seq68:79-879(-)
MHIKSQYVLYNISCKDFFCCRLPGMNWRKCCYLHDRRYCRYVCLGNHDYMGNPLTQIEYTSCEHNDEGLWYLPNSTYHIRHVLEDGTAINFFALDTNGVDSSLRWRHPNLGDVLRDVILPGLDEKLKACPKNEWKIVFGHHPCYTAGADHGVDGELLRTTGSTMIGAPGFGLEKILEDNKVHAYFAGHEHCLQYHKQEGMSTHHFVGGAGSHTGFCGGISERIKLRFIDPTMANGFIAAEVTQDRMTVQLIHALDNKVIHTVQITK